jgi:hypothetical protein
MASNQSFGNLIEVGDVILHSDILTEYFCCDIDSCHGKCCEEGDAGAPVTMDEIADIEAQLDDLWPKLSVGAQSVIDRQGVCYPDPEGELVTSIVLGGNCAFRGPQGCLLKQKPISCHLYPIREKKLGPLTGLNYHRWNICQEAIRLGTERKIRLYEFLREPLIRRFGKEWYDELCIVAEQFIKQEIPH